MSSQSNPEQARLGRRLALGLGLGALGLGASRAMAGEVALKHRMGNGQLADGNKVDTNFQDLARAVNDNAANITRNKNSITEVRAASGIDANTPVTVDGVTLKLREWLLL